MKTDYYIFLKKDVEFFGLCEAVLDSPDTKFLGSFETEKEAAAYALEIGFEYPFVDIDFYTNGESLFKKKSKKPYIIYSQADIDRAV